jgi:hypothetical protein
LFQDIALEMDVASCLREIFEMLSKRIDSQLEVGHNDRWLQLST